MRSKLKVSKNNNGTKLKKPSMALRLLPIALTTFIGVAIAVYCVSWYFQASFARQTVERIIADINSKQQVISYSSIDTSGFPMDVSVRIMQPKFSVRLDPLLAAMPRPAEAQGAPTPPPEWIEEIALHGSLSFSVNVFSDRFTATVLGPITQTSVINQVRTAMDTQPSGPFTCTLQLDRQQGVFAGMWDLEWLSRTQPEEVVRDFRSVECGMPGYITAESSSKDPMVSSGPLVLRFATPAEHNGMRSMEFALRLVDFEFSPRMNNVLNSHLAMLYGGTDGLPNIDMAAYGKQNIDIAVFLHGPEDTRAFSDDTPFVVSVPRFNLTNALYSSLTNMQVENRVNGNTRAVNFQFNSDSSFSKSYDKYLSDYARILVARIKTSKDAELAEIKNSLSAMSTEQSGAMLDPVIPKLHSFGNIAVHINAGLDGDKVLRKGTLNVTTFDITTTPYGISMQGSATLPDGQGGHTPENASFTLTCRNCLMMVDDAARYVQRFQQSLVSLDHELANTPAYLSPQLSQSIQTFLSTVGEKRHDQATGAETLVFVLATDKAGYLSLNGKAPQQIQQLYNAIIVPSLPAAAVASAPAPVQPVEEKTPPGGY